jgi:hypothetical protein
MVLVMGGFIIPISTMGEPAEFALRHDLGVLRARSARRWRQGGPGFSETGAEVTWHVKLGLLMLILTFSGDMIDM